MKWLARAAVATLVVAAFVVSWRAVAALLLYDSAFRLAKWANHNL